MNGTTQIITALNDVWSDIQQRHPEIPSVMLVTGRRRHKSEKNLRGQHCSDTWHVHGSDEKQAEVLILGERLAEGAEAVLQTLLHEAAHALARVRDLKDTSNKNRYHNKIFVKLAEELGLEGPGSSGGPSLGYSDCSVTEAIVKSYVNQVEMLNVACKSFVAPAMTEEEVKPKKAAVKALCECPEPDNEISWTKKYQKKYEERGFSPLLCAICHQPFTPEADPEEKEN